MSTIAPHVCPECGYPAYIGLNHVECTNMSCRHFHTATWEAHCLEDGGQDGQEIGLSLSDYLFDYYKTPSTGAQVVASTTFPKVQPLNFWKSTLTPLPTPRTWSVDPLWVHQASIGDDFNDGHMWWRVASIDRNKSIISAIPRPTP